MVKRCTRGLLGCAKRISEEKIYWHRIGQPTWKHVWIAVFPGNSHSTSMKSNQCINSAPIKLNSTLHSPPAQTAWLDPLFAVSILTKHMLLSMVSFFLSIFYYLWILQRNIDVRDRIGSFTSNIFQTNIYVYFLLNLKDLAINLHHTKNFLVDYKVF